MGVIVIQAFLFLKLWTMCSFLLLMEKGEIIVPCPLAGHGSCLSQHYGTEVKWELGSRQGLPSMVSHNTITQI